MHHLEDAVVEDPRDLEAGTAAEDGLLARDILRHPRVRRMPSPNGPGACWNAGATFRSMPPLVDGHEPMQTIMNSYSHARPARGVRVTEHSGRVTSFPAPHRTPVLPRGWAPLTVDQQRAVLDACDAAPTSVVFRVASQWEADADYRVYQLQNEWTGLWLASRCYTDR